MSEEQLEIVKLLGGLSFLEASDEMTEQQKASFKDDVKAIVRLVKFKENEQDAQFEQADKMAALDLLRRFSALKDDVMTRLGESGGFSDGALFENRAEIEKCSEMGKFLDDYLANSKLKEKLQENLEGDDTNAADLQMLADLEESVKTISTLKSYGVHSIELGAQSMNDQVLELNGRGHSSKDVTMASSLIREYGFSLGLQMMVGMYGVEDAYCDAMETADAFLKIAPDTVRIYPTLVVEDTQLAELWRRGVYKPLDIDEAVKISAELMILFRNKGIRVIRVGLHSENSLQKKTLAGPFHPAFGELCESLIFRNEIENVIIKEKTAIIKCNPKLLSKIIGQNKSNINYFLNKGMDIKVIPDGTVSRFHIEYP